MISEAMISNMHDELPFRMNAEEANGIRADQGSGVGTCVEAWTPTPGFGAY